MATFFSSLPVPPSWRDVGKSSSDLLSRDYPLSGTQLEVKAKAPSGVAFTARGTKDSASNAVNGDFEGRWNDRKKGLSVTQVWNTSNVLRNTIELDGALARGLKLDLATVLTPGSEKAPGGSKGAVLGAVYKTPGLHATAKVDLFKGPALAADVVLSKGGFLVGAEVGGDVRSGQIARYATALGFTQPTYAATVHALGNGSVFSASFYHRLSAEVEVGAKAVFDRKASSDGRVALELGTKAYLDPSSFVKAKVNSAGVVLLGYTQGLRPGVKASFGLALDTVRLSNPVAGAPGHKVGASFTFDL